MLSIVVGVCVHVCVWSWVRETRAVTLVSGEARWLIAHGFWAAILPNARRPLSALGSLHEW